MFYPPTVPVVYYPTAETVIQQPIPIPPSNFPTTTTTKTVTTRVLDPTTLRTIEETKITPEIHDDSFSRSSTSTFYSSTDSSTTQTSTPPAVKTTQVTETIAPTKHLVPTRRILHRPTRLETPNGYISSELDYGKQKIYKTDYKYRHYYCCNLCQGRCDLHNRSYSCCEWFYGCPCWAYLLLALLFLGLIVTFFTLFGLQPSLNSDRRSQTVQTRLLNRTEIIYGFYKNCGYQVNASYVPTTLILCTNTPTTTTARIQLSSYYTFVSNTTRLNSNYFLMIVLFLVFFLFE